MLRASGERWMMNRDDDRSSELIALHPVECGCQKRNLAVIEHGVLAVLTGDAPGVFQHVAIQAEETHERRLKCEVDSGLDHCCTQRAAGVWRLRRGRCAEVAQKGVERRCRGPWDTRR